MTHACPAEPSALGKYGAHSGVVTLVLVALTAATLYVANAGQPVVAAGLYALALVVASPLLLAEADAFRTWLLG